ncbi:hypothetical protein AB0L25_20810 [Spirillospora sp. NPDC052242]
MAADFDGRSKMTVPPSQQRSDGSQYFLIPRDPEGEYIRTAEQITRDHGVTSFTQTVRPSTGKVSDSDRLLLLEMRNALPAQVEIVSENPFLILRIDSAEDSDMALATCQCQCGGSFSCSGGGGGHQ